MISVVIATYNGEKYIEAQLRSVLSQSMSPEEVLIFDDGSTDSTVEVVSRFIEENGCNGWRLFLNEENKGYCKNFLEGALKASGDYVFFCDQDDVWLPDKIKETVNALRNDEELLAVCCAAEVIDGDGNVIDVPKNIGVFFDKDDGSILPFTPTQFVGRSFVRGCSVGFKREVLGFVTPMELKGLLSHDWLITFTAALLGRCAVLNRRLLKYRCHGENTSFGQRRFGMAALNKRIEAIDCSVNGHSFILENCDVYPNMTEGLKRKLESHVAFEQKRISFLKNGGLINFLNCFFALSRYKCYYGDFKGAVKVFLGDISYRSRRKKG